MGSRKPLLFGIAFYIFLFIFEGSSAFAPELQEANSPKVFAFSAQSLLKEADKLSWVDNWSEAGPYYQKAEMLFRQTADERSEAYARIGRLFATADSWTKASQVLHQQLRMPVVRNDLRLQLWCLVLSGYVDIYLSTDSAKHDWEEALNVAKTLGDRRWAARATGELGIVAFFEGNASHAVSLVGQALLSLAANGDRAGEARLLAMVGNAFNEMHRFAEGHWFFTRAISLMKETGNGGYPFNAVLGDAEALAGDGKDREAGELLQSAVSMAELQQQRGYLADALVHLGEMNIKSSDLDAAKEHFERAIRVAQRVELYRVLAAGLIDLASAYRMEGDFTRAEVTLNKALSISRRVGDRYYLPRDLTAAAELKLAEGKPEDAERLFRKAERAIETIVLNLHTDIGQAALSGAMSETYLEHFHLVEERGDAVRAFQLVERIRGRVSASRLKEPLKSSVDSPKREALESEIAAVQSGLLGTNDPKIRSQLQDNLVQSERSLAFEENELSQKWGLLQPATLTSVQNILRNDELLLEYVLDEPKASCIAITAEGARVLQLPEGSKQIEASVRSYVQSLNERGSNETLAAGLGRILLGPAERAYKKQRLIVVPDGILHFLPFEALRDGEGKLIVESKIVSYAPSATALWVLRRRHAGSAPRTLLAVGDVDYSGRQSPEIGQTRNASIVSNVLRDLADLSSSRLHNLPQSRREVLSIAQIAGEDSKVLLGRDASESAFNAEPLSEYRIIHLAVHSIADSHFPDRSALVLAGDSGREDGLLQLREITRLHLRADLVTLSACQTAVGPVEGEAGVISLQMAFLMGGARTVVASLWNVEDESTTLLMEAFYRHLTLNEDKAAALTHAKRELLARNAVPYYWAGFVLVGQGGEPVRLGKPNPAVASENRSQLF